MAKDKTMYVCDYCGQESLKWVGKCPSCNRWNTMKEVRVTASTGVSRGIPVSVSPTEGKLEPVPVRDIVADAEPRIDMGDAELNRVLGGGLVPGSLVLLGGEPGIGKSTLTLQTVLGMSERKILYVSGEESAHQLKMRAERLLTSSQQTTSDTLQDNLLILTETSLENIFNYIKEVKPEIVIIDSIQTISTEDVDSSPGSITQVRECASALLRFAKSSSVPVILIGHINKEGTLAGPKILEHIVDTVIQFEGDQHYMYRILRAM